MGKLKNEFYTRRDTVAVARGLLGKLLVVPNKNGERVSGMIVETEAYLGERDRAAHSYAGRRTARNEVTYGPGGHVYVFFVYGMYYQLNVVCGKSGSPHVVLIRAVEPVEGIETMRIRRGRATATGFCADKDLTSGPGKLCIAFNIDRELNGTNLRSGKIWLEDYRSVDEEQIAVGKRIGIDHAGEDALRPLRFWIRGNPFVSKPRLEISAKN